MPLSLCKDRTTLDAIAVLLQRFYNLAHTRYLIIKSNDEDLSRRVVIDTQKPFNRFQDHTYPGLLRSGLASGDAELRLPLRGVCRRHKGELDQQAPEQHENGKRSRSGEPPFSCYHHLFYPQSSMRTSVQSPIMLLTQSSLSLIHCLASAFEIWFPLIRFMPDSSLPPQRQNCLTKVARAGRFC